MLRLLSIPLLKETLNEEHRPQQHHPWRKKAPRVWNLMKRLFSNKFNILDEIWLKGALLYEKVHRCDIYTIPIRRYGTRGWLKVPLFVRQDKMGRKSHGNDDLCSRPAGRSPPSETWQLHEKKKERRKTVGERINKQANKSTTTPTFPFLCWLFLKRVPFSPYISLPPKRMQEEVANGREYETTSTAR